MARRYYLEREVTGDCQLGIHQCRINKEGVDNMVKNSMTRTRKTNITAEAGKQEILITREFDAPRELVFKAFTDPRLYAQWLGPRRLTMTLEIFEPKNGGS
jgi:hypothetical protein